MPSIRLPGLIDCHVHLRDPGGTHKEDFRTGGSAALAGGFTFVMDMPNNPGAPTFTVDALRDKVRRSRGATACRIGFHFGTNGTNVPEFREAAQDPDVFGLKVYFNETTGDLLLRDLADLNSAFKECLTGSLSSSMLKTRRPRRQ